MSPEEMQRLIDINDRLELQPWFDRMALTKKRWTFGLLPEKGWRHCISLLLQAGWPLTDERPLRSTGPRHARSHRTVIWQFIPARPLPVRPASPSLARAILLPSRY